MHRGSSRQWFEVDEDATFARAVCNGKLPKVFFSGGFGIVTGLHKRGVRRFGAAGPMGGYKKRPPSRFFSFLAL